MKIVIAVVSDENSNNSDNWSKYWYQSKVIKQVIVMVNDENSKNNYVIKKVKGVISDKYSNSSGIRWKE